jgi:hypothetical protein
MRPIGTEQLILPKKIFVKKSQKVSKTAEFHAVFKSVEKVLEKFTEKKVISKNKFDEHE